MSGKTEVQYSEGRGDSMFFVGPAEAPIYVCKKQEVKELFTEYFYFCMEIWAFFHWGFGLPGGVTWDKLDPTLSGILLRMQQHYEQHFSLQHVNNVYQESIINHLKVGFRMKG